MSTDLSDDELMRRAGNGDRVAFGTLVERHLPRVCAIAVRLLASPAESDDIGQEAFLRCWQKAPGWEPSDGGSGTARFTTWLHRIVINLCIDRRRRATPLALDDAPDLPDGAPDALDGLESKESVQRVRAAIGDLPGRQRAALVLCYYEGMSNGEAAEVLEMSVGGVESLLVRARRNLRKSLS
jgi:RNA polymerase sigma-70 factor (ECF subfamily)